MVLHSFQWTSVDELLKLSNLEDLKFRFNPLTVKLIKEEDVRYLVIAKLAKLKVYNNSKVMNKVFKCDWSTRSKTLVVMTA